MLPQNVMEEMFRVSEKLLEKQKREKENAPSWKCRDPTASLYGGAQTERLIMLIRQSKPTRFDRYSRFKKRILETAVPLEEIANQGFVL